MFAIFKALKYSAVDVLRALSFETNYMFKQFFYIAIVSFLLVQSKKSFAEDTNPPADTPVVYTVDMEKVLSESISGKAARSNVESEFKKRSIKLEGLKAELGNLKKAYDSQADVLSEDALYDKSKELMKKEREIALAYKDEQAEMARKNSSEVGKVIEEARKIVSELAKEKSAKFVVEKDRRFVLYSSPDFDLTQQVIKKLDEKKYDL